jgi:hypothetical protein
MVRGRSSRSSPPGACEEGNLSAGKKETPAPEGPGQAPQMPLAAAEAAVAHGEMASRVFRRTARA